MAPSYVTVHTLRDAQDHSLIKVNCYRIIKRKKKKKKKLKKEEKYRKKKKKKRCVIYVNEEKNKYKWKKKRENLWEGGNIYILYTYIYIYKHIYIYIYINERTITMSSLIIPKYTGAAILLSCRNFINSYRRGFFVQLFSIVACIDRYLFREKYCRIRREYSVRFSGHFDQHKFGRIWPSKRR